MKLPITLSFYITRIFIFYLLIVVFCFSILITTVDAIELLRKLSGKELGLFKIIELVLLKFPVFLQDVLPFIVLVASVLTYSKLSKTNELVIVRSAGISAWEFMLPCVITSFIFGALVIALLNPIATSMMGRFEILKAKYFYDSKSKIEIADSGFWIKQSLEKDSNLKPQISENKIISETIIHADDLIKDGQNIVSLKNAFILNFDEQGIFLSRIDTDLIKLKDKNWFIESGKNTDNQANVSEISNYIIPTNIKTDDLQGSFSDAEAISFWKLPSFIQKLQNNGFSPNTYILQFHKILSLPLFFAAMVLIGGVFTLKSPRISRGNSSIAFSIILGFIIYFITNLIFSVGLAGSIPIAFAAWAPIMITGLASIYLMLHLEDGWFFF